ncbi:MAG: alkaline phosphatase family protein [Bdellovibrionota bacterium]
MKNNLLFIVFDSCRFDTFYNAKTPNIDRLGEKECRYAYASWTIPSHAVYMMGASPHTNGKGVFASEVYKKDFANYEQRLNIDGVSFKNFVPELSLPAYLRKQGYRTNALVSMPVLNQTTILNKHFDRYELVDEYNNFDAMLDELTFYEDIPSFYLLNTGETHYPFTLPKETVKDNELLYGENGVFKHLDDEHFEPNLANATDGEISNAYYFMDRMEKLKQKQEKNVEYLDMVMEKLYDIIPRNTHIIITSDHGELFGENGLFGHGPVFHENVFKVPFIEGRLK